MKILIKVTKEILAKSAGCQATACVRNCAIAEAIRELFPNALVGAFDVHLSYGYDAILTEEAIEFRRGFDMLVHLPEQRKAMQPISFEIDVPNELIDKIGIGEVYKILSESKTLEHVNAQYELV